MKQIVCIAAAILVLLASPAHAQLIGVAVNIPGSAFGTWELQMEAATAASPCANKSTARLTIAIDGSLCSGGFLAKTPFTKAGVTDRIYWAQPINNLEFSVSTTSIFEGVSIASAAGGSYGFSRRPSELIAVNDVTTRELAQPQPTSGGDNNQKFFELAEANYPELFPEGLFILTHITSTEFYRYYSATDTFLISRNGVVSARGGKFGAGGVLLGDVNSLVAANANNLPIPLTASPQQF